MKPFLVYLTLLFACQVALFLQGAQADSEHGIPNPIADYGQFVKFPNVSITRWEAEEINIENVLNVLEDTLTQTGGVFQTMAKYTCSSTTSFRNEDSTTSPAFDIKFQERKGRLFSFTTLFLPRVTIFLTETNLLCDVFVSCVSSNSSNVICSLVSFFLTSLSSTLRFCPISPLLQAPFSYIGEIPKSGLSP